MFVEIAAIVSVGFEEGEGEFLAGASSTAAETDRLFERILLYLDHCPTTGGTEQSSSLWCGGGVGGRWVGLLYF